MTKIIRLNKDQQQLLTYVLFTELHKLRTTKQEFEHLGEPVNPSLIGNIRRVSDLYKLVS